MFPLLIIREEIVCLIILLFLLLNAHFYRMGKDSAGFVRLTVFAVGHVVFDIVTAITVNNRDALPEWLNVIFHVTFYIFAVLFAYEFFCCTAENALTKSVARRVRRLALVPGVLFVLLLPLLPIGVKSRHGYEDDIAAIERSYSPTGKNVYCAVFCDINRLRAVNNLYGHAEGDAYISSIGLTDRIFEAFASSGERSYPFVCNMETNVTRLSPLWVEQFDLSGEFVFNFDQVWAQRVHPEDREAFSESVREVLNGKAKSHVMEYRAMNGSGEYVVCTCRGSVYEGKNGEPDLFAGTLVNHGIAESIDPVTGLHNDQIFNEDVQRMLDEGEQGTGSGWRWMTWAPEPLLSPWC